MTRPSESLPDLVKLTRQTARNNSRVNRAMEALTGGVDTLATAASAQQWKQVAEATEDIKRHGKVAGLPLIAEAADDVLHTITTGNDQESLRRVIRLIGATGKSRRKITSRRAKK
jgi:hypothetical protein